MPRGIAPGTRSTRHRKYLPQRPLNPLFFAPRLQIPGNCCETALVDEIVRELKLRWVWPDALGSLRLLW